MYFKIIIVFYKIENKSLLSINIFYLIYNLKYHYINIIYTLNYNYNNFYS